MAFVIRNHYLDIGALTMQFLYKGQPCQLMGLNPRSIHVLKDKEVAKSSSIIGNPMGLYALLMTITVHTSLQLSSKSLASPPTDLATILESFNDVFQAPTSPPPSRLQDHKILFEG